MAVHLPRCLWISGSHTVAPANDLVGLHWPVLWGFYAKLGGKPGTRVAFPVANPHDAGFENGHSFINVFCHSSLLQSVTVTNVTTQATLWDSAQLLQVLFIYFFKCLIFDHTFHYNYLIYEILYTAQSPPIKKGNENYWTFKITLRKKKNQTMVLKQKSYT